MLATPDLIKERGVINRSLRMPADAIDKIWERGEGPIAFLGEKGGRKGDNGKQEVLGEGLKKVWAVWVGDQRASGVAGWT